MEIIMKEFDVLKCLFNSNNCKMGSVLRVYAKPCVMENDDKTYMVLAANPNNELIIARDDALYTADALCNAKQNIVYLYGIKPILFGTITDSVIRFSLPRHVNSLNDYDIDKTVESIQNLLDLTKDKDDYYPEDTSYIPITPNGHIVYGKIMDSLDRPCDDISIVF